MPSPNSNRKKSANLESLTMTKRFQIPKQGNILERKVSNRTTIEVPPPLFLKRRNFVDTFGLFEEPETNDNGLDEVYVPSKPKNNEQSLNILKRRRSSVIMVKEKLLIPFLNDEEDSEEELKKEEEPKKKTNVGRKKKNKDDFDFNISEFANKPSGRFVIRCDKESKEIKLKKNGEMEDKENDSAKDNDVNICYGEDGLREDEEEVRLRIKMKKVKLYWAKKSILIPCALKLSHLVEEDEKNLLEFQDYSQKSVLVQGHGNKQRVPPKPKIEKEEKRRKISFAKRRSFNLVLNVPDEMDEFFGLQNPF